MSPPAENSDQSPESAAPSRAALLAALEAQWDAGVDEALAETPVDRYAASAARAAAPASNAATTDPGAPPSRKKPAPAKPKPTMAELRAEATASARAKANAAQTLDALREALAGFDGSALKAGATNCVFADGDPAASLMVIGEAPGRDEDRIGKPFVGRSGQLLDRMLAAIGLDRAAEDPAQGAYITNVVPFRPLENRTPDDAEVGILTPFMERHIALAAPQIVLCLGNVPSKHLMGANRGITRFRGTWGMVTAGGREIPALATFHPAYLLRSPERKREAWRDLLSLETRLKD